MKNSVFKEKIGCNHPMKRHIAINGQDDVSFRDRCV